MVKSQKFVNVRRENVELDSSGVPVRAAPSYNPLRPEASGLVLKSGAELTEILDASTGKMINPHVPLFIAKAPWYSSIEHVVGERKDGLGSKGKQSSQDWYERGKKQGDVATKYRKGACENCGAMSHKSKDCLDRPRKKGAKYTGKDIMPDEAITKVELGFEAKRDRWNGFDASEQLETVKQWELVEEKRKEMRVSKGLAVDQPDSKDKVSDDSDDDNQEELVDGVAQTIDSKNRITVRNLRIREDTAKYLRNLNVDSAYYDPKTRSMRENPYKDDPNNLLYAGDNFERYGGQVDHVTKLKDFAWEKNVTLDKNPDSLQAMSLQSNPTQTELLYKTFEKQGSKAPVSKEKTSILDKYGVTDKDLEAPVPRELLVGVSEEWSEYDREGNRIDGNKKQEARSRWPEDVLLMNHKSVWGSFYQDGEWGFACCMSLIKGSYCGGIESIQAKRAAEKLLEKELEKQDQQVQRKEKALEREPQKFQQELLYEKYEREKQEKKVREKEKLENARREKGRFEQGLKSLKYGWEKTVKAAQASESGMNSTGGKQVTIVNPETIQHDLSKFIAPSAKSTDEMVPYLPADAKVAAALQALEASKVAAQGVAGFSYLRKKRKWEMNDEEREAYRVVQHHGDDPMAKFIKE